MFGILSQRKYLNKVYDYIHICIDKAGCPRTNRTIEAMKEETESNGGPWDGKINWHAVLGEQISEVAWSHRNYFKKEKLNEFQAAVFSISFFISDLANHGKLKTDPSQTDDYDYMTADIIISCKLLWTLCATLAADEKTEKEFAQVMIIPKNGHPFEE